MKERKKNEEKSKKSIKIRTITLIYCYSQNPITITLINSDFSRIKFANHKLSQNRA
jgi:hypothetical protein